ncbi:NF1 isoform 15, partial [Pan troglodytes]
CTFNLKIEGQLLETSGLCIPANNTLFIVSISKTLAANEPHLTLEFLEECISGFSKSRLFFLRLYKNIFAKCLFSRPDSRY